MFLRLRTSTYVDKNWIKRNVTKTLQYLGLDKWHFTGNGAFLNWLRTVVSWKFNCQEKRSRVDCYVVSYVC